MEEWRTLERRNLMVSKIAEAMRAYPEVLNRSPNDIENTIYQKAKVEAEYNQTVGKVIISIKHQGQRQQQQAAAGYRPNMGYAGGPMAPQQQMVRTGLPQQQYYNTPRPHMVGSYPPQMIGPGGMGGHSHMGGPSPAGMMAQHPQVYANRMAQPMMNNPGMGNMGMSGVMSTGMPPGRQISMIQTRPPPHVVGPQLGMGVEQPVTALPNPSYQFSRQDTSNMISRPPAASSPFAQGYQGSPSAVNIPASHSPAPPPSAYQAPSPAPVKMPAQAPSPRGLMVNSPSTPWNPSSMAVGSPGQPAMPPEANEAYMRKLQELQPYVPLVARMIEKLNRQQGDDRTKTEQYLKLNSLYSLLTDRNKRVPLQTLEKCERALEKLFEKPTAGGGQPATPTSLPPPSVPSLPESQEPPSSVSAPPLPPSPPLTTSCSLMDFKMPHSPTPLATTLFPTFQPAADPISRLPPEKRARLEEQAKQDMVIALRREIAHLRNFNVKQVSNGDKIDGTVNLECSLVDDGLPAVPPLNVQIPHDYPATSPKCIMTAYQGEVKSSFLREVGRLLLERRGRVAS